MNPPADALTALDAIEEALRRFVNAEYPTYDDADAIGLCDVVRAQLLTTRKPTLPLMASAYSEVER